MLFNISTSETSCAVVKRCGKPDECTVAPLNTFATLSLSIRLVKLNVPALDKDYKINLFMKKILQSSNFTYVIGDSNPDNKYILSERAL